MSSLSASSAEIGTVWEEERILGVVDEWISNGGLRRPFHKENIRWDITPILVVELSMVGKEFFL